MNTMAESFFKYGVSDEYFVTVILSPNDVLYLFPDWSSMHESTRFITVYESCFGGGV